jgi:hypothetical protein
MAGVIAGLNWAPPKRIMSASLKWAPPNRQVSNPTPSRMFGVTAGLNLAPPSRMVYVTAGLNWAPSSSIVPRLV